MEGVSRTLRVVIVGRWDNLGIGLCARNMVTIQGPVFNMTGGD